MRIIAFPNDGDDRPEPGEVLTTAVFTQPFPEIAAAALRPADGEDAAATAPGAGDVRAVAARQR